MDNKNVVFEMALGSAMGVVNAATNTSHGVNLFSASCGSLAASALNTWPLKNQERFWSRQTALTGLNLVGSSVLAHLITDSLIHRHHPKPTIVFAPQKECAPCETKSWAERVTKGADEPSIQR